MIFPCTYSSRGRHSSFLTLPGMLPLPLPLHGSIRYRTLVLLWYAVGVTLLASRLMLVHPLVVVFGRLYPLGTTVPLSLLLPLRFFIQSRHLPL